MKNCIEFNGKIFSKSYIPLDKNPWSPEQKPKDCKNTTPDKVFCKGDKVKLYFDTKSIILDYPVEKGIYIFNSYDSFDNTCFLKKEEKGLTVNISLIGVKKIITFSKCKK